MDATHAASSNSDGSQEVGPHRRGIAMSSPEISASTAIAAHLKTANNILRALRHQDVVELVLDTAPPDLGAGWLLSACPAGSTIPFIVLLSFVLLAEA